MGHTFQGCETQVYMSLLRFRKKKIVISGLLFLSIEIENRLIDTNFRHCARDQIFI